MLLSHIACNYSLTADMGWKIKLIQENILIENKYYLNFYASEIYYLFYKKYYVR